MDRIEFEEDGLQPSDLLRGIDKSLVVSGEVEAKSAIKWSQLSLKSNAEINIRDVGVSQDGVQVKGINGDILIDELFPLSILKTQEIVAEEIAAAANISKPSLKFRIKTANNRPVLYVDELKLGLAGGTALIEKEKIDIGAPSNKMNVVLTNLDLEKLMALGDVGEVTASGTLNGRVPLYFDGERLLIDVGVLDAAGPGILQLKSEKARQALSAGGSQTDLLFDILENFQYSELSLRIKKQLSGEDTVILHTKGSNPDVENNRAVVLNINLQTNLDKILNTVLEGYLLSEKALRATVKGKQN